MTNSSSSKVATGVIVMVVILALVMAVLWAYDSEPVYGDNYARDDVAKALGTPEDLEALKSQIEENAPWKARTSKKAINLKPLAKWVSANAVSCLDRGIVEIGLNNLQLALQNLECALKQAQLDSVKSRVHHYLNLVHYLSGRYDLAEHHFGMQEQILASLGKKEQIPASTYVTAALTAVGQGDTVKADSLWEEALKRDEGELCVSFYYAKSLFEIKRYESAAAYLDTAIDSCQDFREDALLLRDVVQKKLNPTS